MTPPSGAGPISDGSPAPWVLPKVWPPAISATVSSSFIAMRKNVSRTSLGAAIGVRFAIRAFWIDVDEAHLHRAERLRELAFAAVALIAEPRPLGTPEQLFRLPDIGAAAGKTEGFEAHRLKRDIAGKDHQVRPRNLVAVFLLDGPQQPARLSRLALSRQLFNGAKRCWPAPAPPRPSVMRYVPALCHAM